VATISADLTDITSNDSRPDNAIQQTLATSRYPTATFVLTTPVDVGSVPAEGRAAARVVAERTYPFL
jgi:hypothetical protein